VSPARWPDSLRQDPDGIWRPATAAARLSYPEHGHQTCFAVEDNSFWFRHRNACIVAAVRRHPPCGTLFDIGGGNGSVAAALAAAGHEVCLLEPGPDGARHARARGLQQVVCATLDSAGFAPGSLPAVGLFDVVEHVEDDLGFLRDVHLRLADAGMLYATVPAHRGLWSQEDVDAGHFRRHSLDSITRLLIDAGFAVRYASHYFRPLPLPIWLLRTLPSRLGLKRRPDKVLTLARREHLAGHGPVARLLEWLLAPEVGHIEQGRSMRIGASCLVIAQRLP
jgi:SAM-dependent methyltransferase